MTNRDQDILASIVVVVILVCAMILMYSESADRYVCYDRVMMRIPRGVQRDYRFYDYSDPHHTRLLFRTESKEIAHKLCFEDKKKNAKR